MPISEKRTIVTPSSSYPSLLTRLWRYLRLFVQRPSEVASVSPSSPFLTRKLCELSNLTSATCVVELGPGDGSTTTALLAEMPSSARLLAIELVPELAEMLRTIQDSRCIVEQADAAELGRLLSVHRLPPVDVVVSGIPFSNLSEPQALEIIDQVYHALRPGGTFVAYQFRDDVHHLASGHFGSPEDVSFVPFNLPPVHLYRWIRPADVAPPKTPAAETNQEFAAVSSVTRQASAAVVRNHASVKDVSTGNGESVAVGAV